MRNEILNYILENTDRPRMVDKTTNEVAKNFGKTTRDVYAVLNKLANDGLITKLEPVNGDDFSCCGWINNE